jgi:hypothetical protein
MNDKLRIKYANSLHMQSIPASKIESYSNSPSKSLSMSMVIWPKALPLMFFLYTMNMVSPCLHGLSNLTLILLPVGIQVAFQQVPHKSPSPVKAPHSQHSNTIPRAAASTVTTAPVTSNPATLKVTTAAPVASHPATSHPKPEKNWTDLPSFDLSNPAKCTPFVPLNPQPPSACKFDQGVIATSLANIEGGWNEWVNGPFWIEVTHEEFVQTKRLLQHWATKGNSSDNGKGSVHSPTPAGGKVTNKKCLGVLECQECGAITRPQVNFNGLQKQLSTPCTVIGCGGAQKHVPCLSRSYLIQYGQIGDDTMTSRYHYINGTDHMHSRIPTVARTTAYEDKKFQAAYENCPRATATQMMAGAPAPKGFGPGAAELGQKFANRDYTGYRLRWEQKKDGNGLLSAFGTFNKLGNWKQQHPSVLCKEFISDNMVCLSLQTEWMRQQAIPNMSSVDSPLHGILSDAAHKYWEDPNGRLIVSSVFSPVIQKWVPLLFTYANGATTEHYEYHFLILIEGIIQTASERKIQITDDLFAGVGFLKCTVTPNSLTSLF